MPRRVAPGATAGNYVSSIPRNRAVPNGIDLAGKSPPPAVPVFFMRRRRVANTDFDRRRACWGFGVGRHGSGKTNERKNPAAEPRR